MTLGQRALRLVQIPSPIGHEAAIADEVEQWAKRVFPPQDILRVSHSFVLGCVHDARPSIALVGHLDTVPEHPQKNVPRIEGDRLYGLGSSDMKGALAVMMALAESLPLAQLPVNVIFILYEREEGPFEESGLGPLFERVPRLSQLAFAIAMEPTDETVQVGCLGSLHATLTFDGQAAHSARPWQGKNAIHAAGSVLDELHRTPRREVVIDGHTFYEVKSVTLAHGGRARNVVPDLFELNLNLRFAPGKSVAQAQREILEWIDGRCRVTFLDAAPSGHLCGQNRYFQKLEKLSGRPAEPKLAWTDVARFSALGVDAVNFGPGETAQAHQHNESASIAAMERTFQLFMGFFTSLSPL